DSVSVPRGDPARARPRTDRPPLRPVVTSRWPTPSPRGDDLVVPRRSAQPAPGVPRRSATAPAAPCGGPSRPSRRSFPGPSSSSALPRAAPRGAAPRRLFMSATSSSAATAARSADRAAFAARTAFIFAAIGSAVGLGNIWRFPAVAYENGGGAFILPYLVALLTAGIPLLFLDY